MDDHCILFFYFFKKWKSLICPPHLSVLKIYFPQLCLQFITNLIRKINLKRSKGKWRARALEQNVPRKSEVRIEAGSKKRVCNDNKKRYRKKEGDSFVFFFKFFAVTRSIFRSVEREDSEIFKRGRRDPRAYHSYPI